MTACPATYLQCCRCPFPAGIIAVSSNTAYYPTSDLLVLQGSPHKLILSAKGRHYTEAIMHSIADGSVMRSVPFLFAGRFCYNLAAIVVDGSTGLCRTAWWTLTPCSSQVLRVQAWLRGRIELRRRRLALAMALHPRLGKNSSLACLCGDQMRMIV